jgi:hypothetical protein
LMAVRPTAKINVISCLTNRRLACFRDHPPSFCFVTMSMPRLTSKKRVNHSNGRTVATTNKFIFALQAKQKLQKNIQ